MQLQHSEHFLSGHENCRLYVQKWTQKNPRGTVFITHGQGEHSGSYQRVVSSLSENQWNVVAWDLRGHGRSEGLRGYVQNFTEYIEDLKIFLQETIHLQELGPHPRVLLGHSMGGLIQLRCLTENTEIQRNFQAQVLSSPALGLALPIPLWKTKGSQFLKNWLPQLTVGNEITYEMCTQDLDVIHEMDRDPLRHHKISPAAFLGFMESWDIVLPQADKIRLPTLLQIPENDPIVNSQASRQYYDRMGTQVKDLFVYPGLRHEIYNDRGRENVLADLNYFLNKIVEQNL